uniref:NADH-ubiquinone oxidoreductase chain 6 n=1 Tax=Scolytinae sp. BMNH 1274277 TaxID=2558032 RepID=A0A126TDY3_9CUCU|nr:NADH dehydrogenase subunit 6 [Scolytinae sp. BMNH 1274277]
MTSLLLIMNCLLSILMMFFKTPLSKGFMLLMLTISTSMLASTLHLNSWFGYILFLIMVGGILVAFIYMTSIASNEKLNFPKMILSMLFLMIMLVIIVIMLFSFLSMNHFSYAMLNSYDSVTISFNSKMFLTKIFSWPMIQIPMALMSYLFLTLIMVVKMTDFIKGPIRQK